jgi:hypothetical protein
MTTPYSAPILPTNFRILNIGGRCTGTSKYNIDIANSRKWTVHLFDPITHHHENHKLIANPVVVVDKLEHPNQITRILTFPGAQLVIFEPGSCHSLNNPEIANALWQLLQRSHSSGNYEHPISVIVTAQYFGQIAPQLRGLFTFTNISHDRYQETREKTHQKLVPHISQEAFNDAQTKLKNYCRIHVNNVQKAMMVHNPHMLHIPAHL